MILICLAAAVLGAHGQPAAEEAEAISELEPAGPNQEVVVRRKWKTDLKNNENLFKRENKKVVVQIKCVFLFVQ